MMVDEWQGRLRMGGYDSDDDKGMTASKVRQ